MVAKLADYTPARRRYSGKGGAGESLKDYGRRARLALEALNSDRYGGEGQKGSVMTPRTRKEIG